MTAQCRTCTSNFLANWPILWHRTKTRLPKFEMKIPPGKGKTTTGRVTWMISKRTLFRWNNLFSCKQWYWKTNFNWLYMWMDGWMDGCTYSTHHGIWMHMMSSHSHPPFFGKSPNFCCHSFNSIFKYDIIQEPIFKCWNAHEKSENRNLYGSATLPLRTHIRGGHLGTPICPSTTIHMLELWVKTHTRPERFFVWETQRKIDYSRKKY